MSTYAIIGLVSFLGAIIQATMGFGGAVILINVMPLFFPYQKAVALVQGCLVVLNIVYVAIYWKKIRWDILAPCLISGIIVSFALTLVSTTIEGSTLTILLGVLFICLSLYYMFVVDRIHMVPSKLNGLILGGLSGFTNAFFGMAGPPVALYLVPSFDDKMEYFASSQAFFMLSSIMCIGTRIVSGIYEVSDLPVLGYLSVIFIGGSVIGLKLLKKIDGKVLRKIIYGFIGMNGIYIIMKQMLAR